MNPHEKHEVAVIEFIDGLKLLEMNDILSLPDPECSSDLLSWLLERPVKEGAILTRILRFEDEKEVDKGNGGKRAKRTGNMSVLSLPIADFDSGIEKFQLNANCLFVSVGKVSNSLPEKCGLIQVRHEDAWLVTKNGGWKKTTRCEIWNFLSEWQTRQYTDSLQGIISDVEMGQGVVKFHPGDSPRKILQSKESKYYAISVFEWKLKNSILHRICGKSSLGSHNGFLRKYGVQKYHKRNGSYHLGEDDSAEYIGDHSWIKLGLEKAVSSESRYFFYQGFYKELIEQMLVEETISFCKEVLHEIYIGAKSNLARFVENEFGGKHSAIAQELHRRIETGRLNFDMQEFEASLRRGVAEVSILNNELFTSIGLVNQAEVDRLRKNIPSLEEVDVIAMEMQWSIHQIDRNLDPYQQISTAMSRMASKDRDFKSVRPKLFADMESVLVPLMIQDTQLQAQKDRESEKCRKLKQATEMMAELLTKLKSK